MVLGWRMRSMSSLQRPLFLHRRVYLRNVEPHQATHGAESVFWVSETFQLCRRGVQQPRLAEAQLH